MCEEVQDQTAENRRSPNRPVTPEELADLGVLNWHVPATGSSYPAKAVPWEPSGIQDARLASIRTQRGYNYADIITCSEECLPDYHEKLKAFFTEHIHSDEEVRYIVNGSGYFDIRDRNNEWIRIQLNAGDLIILPEGIYHRFTMDSKNYTHAMRLFKGEPVWTPINRPADEHMSRQRYIQRFHHFEEERSLRETVASCLRSFFQQSWCLGSSGAMAVLVGPESNEWAPMLVTPSGVPKELLRPEDIFLISRGMSDLGSGELLKVPKRNGQDMKVSDSCLLFEAVFQKRKDIRAITHIHSVSAVLVATTCQTDLLRVSDLEMIKGLGVAADDVLEVPIIPNQPTEPQLVPAVLRALEAYPTAPAILVRNHGVYVFGRTVEKAKIATECLSFVFEVLREQPQRLLGEASLSTTPPFKRRRLQGGPSVILLDIEGTTTPISFVKDKLFPYAANAVGSWLKAASPEELRPVIESFKEQCHKDGVPFEENGGATDQVEKLTKEWIAKDRKVPALKDLQGTLWRAGYEKGELKGEMFGDTSHAIAGWVAAGRRVAIFSSGSREAQRLIFQYSDKGDLTGHLSAYFDPKSALASKQESKAYEEIALSLGIDPKDGLFCTDVLAEARAAKKAGWSSTVLVRPGNAPLPPDHGFREARSLLNVW